jgi:RNA polymerase sigma-70 factor (ECF subfamily)
MGAARTGKIAKSGLNEELIRACQDGRPEAHSELYECYKAKVYSLALYMTGDSHTAEDLTQEIFVKVFRDLPGFRFDASFSSWLYRVATNTCLNSLRGRRGRREVAIEGVAGTRQEFDPKESLEEQEMRKQVERAVRDAILTLKPSLRVVVLLRYVEDLSYSDISMVLSCSEGTVASRLSRAHRVLERKLKSLDWAVSL